MTRSKKTIRNLLLLIILIPLFMGLNGLYFSPIKALHASERDLHYGPTEIVHSFDYGGMRYFLGRYENYITFSPIKRSLGIFWRYGGGFGSENRPERPIFYGYRNDGSQLMLYGVLNDENIAWVEIEKTGLNGKIAKKKIDEFYENLFYLIWESEEDDIPQPGSIVESKITAYDVEGEIVYETLF